MCNLYSITRSREAMLRLFRVGDNRAARVEPKTAIFPGYVAPIVRKADDGERELVNLNWGFVLLQKGLAPRRVTNVRDDKILESRFWRGSFEERRCLVPASKPQGRPLHTELVAELSARRGHCELRSEPAFLRTSN